MKTTNQVEFASHKGVAPAAARPTSISRSHKPHSTAAFKTVYLPNGTALNVSKKADSPRMSSHIMDGVKERCLTWSFQSTHTTASKTASVDHTVRVPAISHDD